MLVEEITRDISTVVDEVLFGEGFNNVKTIVYLNVGVDSQLWNNH